MTNTLNLSIRPEFRANLIAQAGAFILNVWLYIISGSYFWIWTELACFCFIGINSAKSPRFIDRNILNHFISVMVYYLISLLVESSHILYLSLIFVFTYVYFILKENGFNKSLNLWMYIQALLIGTTFTAYPFQYKILATVFGYVEAQLILAASFKILSSSQLHEAELRYRDVITIPLREWFDLKQTKVQLALRGSITAATLYALCTNFHDLKPNWAVVTAIACLQRQDLAASFRAVKGVAIGTILGWPISLALIHFLLGHTEVGTSLIWIFLLAGLICTFELTIRPQLWLQILSTVLMLQTGTSVAIALDVNEYGYLNLKAFNSLLGIGMAAAVLIGMHYLKRLFSSLNPG